MWRRAAAGGAGRAPRCRHLETRQTSRSVGPRLLRDSVAAATIAFDYHYSLWSLQQDSPAWLSAKHDAHLRSGNRLQDLCFLNGGIYIKLGKHIAQLMVSALAGVITSIIGKLTALLGEEYAKLKGVHREVEFMKDELSSMNALLQRLADDMDKHINEPTQRQNHATC
ncbi:hypothetical protein ZWY2020_024844 [Hordeum vulgare]|nr:hypothetical protein ZWY2020_024844 [Hordeum vulgare]